MLLHKNFNKRLTEALSSEIRYLAPCPSASMTDSQENEKVKETDARKNITIKIKEPTTPKILERFEKMIDPIRPPEED